MTNSKFSYENGVLTIRNLVNPDVFSLDEAINQAIKELNIQRGRNSFEPWGEQDGKNYKVK